MGCRSDALRAGRRLDLVADDAYGVQLAVEIEEAAARPPQPA